MVSCEGEGRWVRWKAARERPMVPVPMRVMWMLGSFSIFWRSFFGGGFECVGEWEIDWRE